MGKYIIISSSEGVSLGTKVSGVQLTLMLVQVADPALVLSCLHLVHWHLYHSFFKELLGDLHISLPLHMEALIGSRGSQHPFLVAHPSLAVVVEEVLLVNDVFEVLLDLVQVYVGVLLDQLLQLLPLLHHVELVYHHLVHLVRQARP